MWAHASGKKKHDLDGDDYVCGMAMQAYIVKEIKPITVTYCRTVFLSNL